MIRHEIIRLTKDEEKFYLETLDNEESKIMLFKSRIVIALNCAKKYLRMNIDREDIEQTAIVGLWKGINSYKIDNTANLSTYVSVCIENELKMLARKVKNKSKYKYGFVELHKEFYDRYDNRVTYEECISYDRSNIFEDINEVINNTELLNNLSDIEKDIIICKVIFGYSQTELAKKHNLSQSAISRMISILNKKIEC